MIGIIVFCFILAVISLISFIVSAIKSIKSMVALFLISYICFWGLFCYCMYLDYPSDTTHVQTSEINTTNNINNQAVSNEENAPSTENTTNTSNKPQEKQKPEHYGEIVANTDSKIYHMPGGAYYDKSFENLSNNVYFKTEQEAINSGYRKSTR